VVSGHCTRTGAEEDPPNTLIWDLTFGSKDSTDALNIIVEQDGTVTPEETTIDAPPNSTSEFAPLLTFTGSEDIFYNYSDENFYDVIFTGGKIDFDSVNYSVRTNLQYPSVDITTLWLLEHSKYCYLVTSEERGADSYESTNVALDAETGQLLFYWEHQDSGFDLFSLMA
jgi:hypothetical protein